MALVLQEANALVNEEDIDRSLKAAREAASLVYVVQTKVDLIPRDFSPAHKRLLQTPAWFRYYRDIDCFPISTVTGEGIDELVCFIGMFNDLAEEHSH